MEQEKNIILYEKVWTVLLLLLSAVSMGYVVIKQKFWLIDIETYYKNMSGVIYGRAEDIKLVMPWARLTGQLLCPGFVPYKACLVYYYVLLLAGTVFLGFLAYRYIRGYGIFSGKAVSVVTAVCVCILPFYWHDVLNTGNVGGIVCILIMISAFFVDEHPYLAAFLLSLAMTKPQDAGIFIAVLFFRKNFKTVFTTAGICGAGWGCSAVYLHFATGGRMGETQQKARSLVEIIKKYGDSGISNEKYSFYTYGIFDPLVDYGVSTVLVLLLSVLLGIALAAAACLILGKDPDLRKDPVFYFGIAAVISILWCYKSPCDEIVMVLSSLAALRYLADSGKGIRDYGIVLAAFVLFNFKVFRFWIEHLLHLGYDWSVFADELLRLAAMAVIIVMLVKRHREGRYGCG